MGGEESDSFESNVDNLSTRAQMCWSNCMVGNVGLSVQFPVTVYKCSKDYVVMQLTKVETRIN